MKGSEPGEPKSDTRWWWDDDDDDDDDDNDNDNDNDNDDDDDTDDDGGGGDDDDTDTNIVDDNYMNFVDQNQSEGEDENEEYYDGDTDDEDFDENITSINIDSNESLLCDPHEYINYRWYCCYGSCGTGLLNSTDEEINNELDVSNETSRRRNIVIKDDRNLSNVDIFFPIEGKQIDLTLTLTDDSGVDDNNDDNDNDDDDNIDED